MKQSIPYNPLFPIRIGIIAFSILTTVNIIYLNKLAYKSPERYYFSFLEFPDQLEPYIKNRSEKLLIDEQGKPIIHPVIFNFYLDRRYPKLIRIFRGHQKNNSRFFRMAPNRLNYYLGLCLMQMDSSNQAIQAFGKVTKDPHLSDANWFKALCILRAQGITIKSKREFVELIEANHPRKEEAEHILKKLFDI